MCPILYAPDYSSAMSLYRTLTSSNHESTLASPLAGLELSARALALTTHLIKLNASHFSVWQYRAQILLHSSQFEAQRSDILRAELAWLDDLAHSNMKSYQVWQHRRLVVAALGDPDGELRFVQENLQRDAKNYHTWGYRQWILAHFGGLTLASSSNVASKGAGEFKQLWDREAQYVDELLREDVRNNSAWNHRWFVHFSRYGLTGNRSMTSIDHLDIESIEKTIKFEKAYVRTWLCSVPNNASAWSYLRALHTAFPQALRSSMCHSLGWVKTLVSSEQEAKRDASVDAMGRACVGALEWWFDCLVEQTEHADQTQNERLLQQAELLVQRLCVADSVRTRFWAYRLKSLRRTLQQR